jgi:uncharacterized protein YcgI (DUF1989 family)
VQQAHETPRPSSIIEDFENRVRVIEKHLHAEKQLTATLEEALVDLEGQSNKIRADAETWKKKASQYQGELQDLKKGRSLLGKMPVPEQDSQTSTTYSTSAGGKTHTHIVPAAHGYAFEVKSGDRFRIVDLHGQQVVDFMAWCLPFKHSNEHLSMSYTRHAIGGDAPPQVGECLYTNKDEPIFKLLADTVKTHDMLYMACNPGFYKRLGQEGHRSCATNVAEAMKEWGMESWMEVTDPFNIFQNTPYYSLKALNCSRAGDYVEFEALKDAVCAVSSCPFDSNGFNGGCVTEVAVVTGI